MTPSVVNESEAKINILQLHFYMIQPILKYLPLKDVISFGSTCKTAQKTVKQIKLTHVDLRNYYDLNERNLLTRISLDKCVCLNLNHCYWLTPDVILKLLELTNVKHLHLLECRVTSEIIEKIASLQLKSLSISWTSYWFFYLQHNLNHTIPCFQNLTDLEIFYPVSLNPVYYCVNRVCSYVLSRCKLLENLKLHEYPYFQFCSHSIVEHAFSEVLQKPNATPLGHLKTIDVNFINCQLLTKCVAYLLDAILPENGSPLSNVNLGMQSIPLLKEKIPIRKLQLLQKSSTFCLGSASCFQTKPLLKELFWRSNEHVQSTLSHSNYKQFILRNLQFEDFMPIARIIAANSGNTVEKVDLAGCQTSQSLCLGLHLIVSSCIQLTFLDLTFNTWKCTSFFSQFLLEAIGNLKDLKQLHLTPFQIGILSTNNPRNHSPTIPSKYKFWKITSRCKNLEQIRIVNPQKHFTCIVHEETLAHIALCQNLKELHLVNFNTYGNQSALPRITTGCTKLETVYIMNLVNNNEDVNILSMDEFLKNAKYLKQLSLMQRVPMTKAFTDALCNCSKLEKINLDFIEAKHAVINYLSKNLHKLKNMWTFRMKGHRYCSTGRTILAELEKRQQSNPAFVFRLDYLRFQSIKELLNTFQVLPTLFTEHAPVAHFHLQRYSFVFLNNCILSRF